MLLECPPQPNLMQFFGKFGKIIYWRPVLQGILDPPLLKRSNLSYLTGILYYIKNPETHLCLRLDMVAITWSFQGVSTHASRVSATCSPTPTCIKTVVLVPVPLFIPGKDETNLKSETSCGLGCLINSV